MITVFSDTIPDPADDPRLRINLLVKDLSRAAEDVHFGCESQFRFTDVVKPPEELTRAKMLLVLVSYPFQIAIRSGREPSGIITIVFTVHEDFVTTLQVGFR